FSPKLWNRKTCEELEKEIECVWDKKLQNCKVYNGQKFRYAGNEIDKNVFKLNLGMTCYRDIIGISQSQNVQTWKTMGEENFGNSQAYLSNGLGVGILAFTDDDHIVLIRRAKWVGEYPGFFDRPGGHPEPEKVPDIQENPQAKETHASIANEIWNSPVDELVEEVGVSSDQIESPKLLGTVQNLSLPGRPSLEFLT
ncbi:Nucleoside diphosphate-linked moiety X motif 22, partial [Armadillidium nasatum]